MVQRYLPFCNPNGERLCPNGEHSLQCNRYNNSNNNNSSSHNNKNNVTTLSTGFAEYPS